MVASWLQPMHLLPWMTWHSELLAFAAIVVAIVSVAWRPARVGTAGLEVPNIVVLPMAVMVLMGIQFAIGQVQFLGDAVVIALYLMGAAIALVVGHALYQRGNFSEPSSSSASPMEILAKLIAVAAVLSVGIALVQALGVWESQSWINRTASFRRSGANIGQPNNLATLLLMGCVSVAVLYEKKCLSSSMAIVLQCLLIVGLAMTESRTGLLSAGILTAWWAIKRGAIASRITAMCVAGLWVLLLSAVWVWPQWITGFHFASDIKDAAAVINTAAGTRLVVWPQLMSAVLLHPWIGWGLREVSRAHNAVLDRYASSEPFTYAHNILLDSAIGAGLPLTVSLVGLGSLWLWRRTSAAKSTSSWYCIALCLPVAVHSFLEFPFAYAYFLFPVMLFIGALEAELAPGRTFRLPRSLLSGIITLSAAVMVWSAVEYVAVEEDFRIARFEALNVGKTADEYVRPNIVLLTQLRAMLEATRVVPKPKMSGEQIELLRSAALRFPWTAVQNRYALSLALNGNALESIRQIKVMRAMHGEKTHQSLMKNWAGLMDTKYPQLAEVLIAIEK